jgi:hypothetical protein
VELPEFTSLGPCPHYPGWLELPRRYPDGKTTPFNYKGKRYWGFPSVDISSIIQFETCNGEDPGSPEYEYDESSILVRDRVLSYTPYSPETPEDIEGYRWDLDGSNTDLFADPPVHDEIPPRFFELGDIDDYLWHAFNVGDSYLTCSGRWAFISPYHFWHGKAMLRLYARPSTAYYSLHRLVINRFTTAPIVAALGVLGLTALSSAACVQPARSRRRKRTD